MDRRSRKTAQRRGKAGQGCDYWRRLPHGVAGAIPSRRGVAPGALELLDDDATSSGVALLHLRVALGAAARGRAGPVRERRRPDAPALQREGDGLLHVEKSIVHLPVVLQQLVDVDAARGALQPQTTVQKHVDIDVARLVLVQEQEEPLCILRLKPERDEIGPNTIVVEKVLHLGQAHRPGAVGVHLVEQVAHLLAPLLLELHLLLYEILPLRPGRLHGVVDENTCDNIENGQHGESNVKQEED
mmetsp:Transcript_35795/g.93468  ORF Transcript_35795/g.93468 Transcript_35795/m.93468 type:complete len:244 (+) Transcript_35795:205-936(+)